LGPPGHYLQGAELVICLVVTALPLAPKQCHNLCQILLELTVL
jgi:hypothetical protein